MQTSDDNTSRYSPNRHNSSIASKIHRGVEGGHAREGTHTYREGLWKFFLEKKGGDASRMTVERCLSSRNGYL